MDTHLEGLFASLEASFGAAVERQEDEAATDLAFSLKQGLGQRDVLARRGFCVVSADASHPALELARDHVLTEGDRLFPLSACAAVLRPDLAPPLVTDARLVEVLRARALEGHDVEIRTAEHDFAGRLALCAPDHVALTTARGEVVIPLAAVLSVRFSPED